MDRRASWLELFFDLVVVVAVAVLADRLHEDPGPVDVLFVLMLYLAVWLVWVSFMLYGNIAGDNTHQRAMIVAMGCIAVMAASIPSIHTAHSVDSSRAFAVAYVVARVGSFRVWRTTAKALVEWPIAQMSVGLVPWVVSIFVPGDWRYYLWALGLVLDIGFAITADDRNLLMRMLRHDDDERARRRKSAHASDQPAPGQGGGLAGALGVGPTERVEITEATVNVSHLDERLGVFMIIVLGEAVSQVVLAASGHPWSITQPRGAAASFLLLVGLWWLTFQYGYAASPESALARMPARFGLPLHYLTSASIIFIASGLGPTVAEPGQEMATGARWLACGGLAGYFLSTAIAAILVGASRVWLLGWALPSILLPIVVGVAGARLAGWGVAAFLLVAVLWQISYRWFQEGGWRRRRGPAAEGAAPGATTPADA